MRVVGMVSANWRIHCAASASDCVGSLSHLFLLGKLKVLRASETLAPQGVGCPRNFGKVWVGRTRLGKGLLRTNRQLIGQSDYWAWLPATTALAAIPNWLKPARLH